MTFVVISTFILVTVVIFLITLNSCFTIYLKFKVKVSSLMKNKYGTSESICIPTTHIMYTHFEFHSFNYRTYILYYVF